MIKEKYINTKVVGRTIGKYKELGYECNVGDNIDVKIEDFSTQSHENITAICDKCGNERQLSLYAYHKNYNNGKYYVCNNCKQDKIENTNMERYGVKRPIQNKEIREKLEITNNEIYGVGVASKNKEIIQKIINTNLERYNETSTAKLQTVKDKQRKTNENKILNKYSTLNILNIDNGMCTFICEEVHEYKISFSNLHNRIKYGVKLCTICNPLNNFSDKEVQLIDFIKSNYDSTIIINDRKILNGKELDIYLPDLNLAFEFNGLYWHSEIYKDKDNHYNKTKICKENNIQLIHVYEDDWDNKQKIIKSMILNKLGIINSKIFARKCEIKVVENNNIIRDFLNDNHIQGYVGSSVKLGLYHNNELISLMTFKNTNNTYELNRFCNKLNFIVVGGFSKLLKHFMNNYKYKKIISFAKLDYSYGKIYEKYFKFVEQQKPDYSYIVNGIRKHKFNFRMKKEKEQMFDKGYYKIYNCGLLKYEILFK